MTKKKILLLVLVALFALDFLCYKIYGFGIVWGNLLTVDIDVMISLHGA